MTPTPDTTGTGQESVWSYPRPPVAERIDRRLIIEHRGVVLADTIEGVRTLETSHPPTYYFPRRHVNLSALRSATGRSFCEWKGWAEYFDLDLFGDVIAQVAWSYPRPSPGFELIKEHVAFYAAPFDRCRVDGQQVTPQPGGFYGGWITSREAGPFKGVPGSRFW
jgi:uncharacterized protein (DUF427 family)